MKFLCRSRKEPTPYDVCRGACPVTDSVLSHAAADPGCTMRVTHALSSPPIKPVSLRNPKTRAMLSSCAVSFWREESGFYEWFRSVQAETCGVSGTQSMVWKKTVLSP